MRGTALFFMDFSKGQNDASLKVWSGGDVRPVCRFTGPVLTYIARPPHERTNERPVQATSPKGGLELNWGYPSFVLLIVPLAILMGIRRVQRGCS